MDRIATSQLYSRSLTQMTGLNVKADRLQTQIASGKSLTAASQGAAEWGRLSGLKRAAASDKANDANMQLAAGILAQSDTALGSMTDQLQRAQELAIQAANGTLSGDQRALIAGQIDAIAKDLVGIANQKDTRGVAIFGGGGDAAFAAAPVGVQYVGGTNAGSVPIGDGIDVQVTEDGTRLAEMFAALAAVGEAVRDGSGIGEAAEGLKGALDTVAGIRGSVGARAMRLDMEMERLDDVALNREEARQAIEDTDVTAAITELQQTLTILSATQASFTKLTSLSLFDQLR